MTRTIRIAGVLVFRILPSFSFMLIPTGRHTRRRDQGSYSPLQEIVDFPE